MTGPRRKSILRELLENSPDAAEPEYIECFPPDDAGPVSDKLKFLKLGPVDPGVITRAIAGQPDIADIADRIAEGLQACDILAIDAASIDQPDTRIRFVMRLREIAFRYGGDCKGLSKTVFVFFTWRTAVDMELHEEIWEEPLARKRGFCSRYPADFPYKDHVFRVLKIRDGFPVRHIWKVLNGTNIVVIDVSGVKDKEYRESTDQELRQLAADSGGEFTAINESYLVITQRFLQIEEGELNLYR